MSCNQSNLSDVQKRLNCNFWLVGLTAIGISIFCPSVVHSTPILVEQTSEVVVPKGQQNLSQFCKNIPASRLFVKTELLFGLSKPDGREVNNSEFQQFLAREVTPRFPEGLTLISGRGQYKNTSGQIIREPSNLLILIYPSEQLSHNSLKIECIRKAYKLEFKQESVLRSDELSCVSF